MSSEADSFNATGSVVTFETLNNNNQAFGVSVTGSRCGVYGESSQHPVGTRPKVGDVPDFTGVAGKGDLCGVQGAGRVGVQGLGGSEKNGIGVFGTSDKGAGIKGQSSFGDAVFGQSGSGRGGVFKSDDSAQVQLLPHAVRGSLSNPVATPVMVIPIKEGPALPKLGRGGDLMAIVDGTRKCTLWFCVKDSAGTAAAKWTQVLLGASFDGLV